MPFGAYLFLLCWKKNIFCKSCAPESGKPSGALRSVWFLRLLYIKGSHAARAFIIVLQE